MALVTTSSSYVDLWFEETSHSQKQRFSLTLITPTTDEKTLKIVKRTLTSALRDWQEIVETRKMRDREPFLHSRNYTDLMAEDDVAYLSYKGIASRISFELGMSTNYFMLLTDSDQRVQAVAVLIESEEAIEVASLLSAAWNIAMHGENAPEHKKIAVKGAGTTLMRQIYEFARAMQKSKVHLDSSKHAEGFYKKLKMKANGDRAYYFDVSATDTPETLQSSKNLLSTM